MKYLLFAYLLPFFVAQNTPTPTLFPVVHNARWGYINANGDLVIPCQFDNAQYFSEGLAAVRLGGFYGYIDTAGRWAIPPQYDYVFPFSEGFAIAHESETPFFIDKNGKKPFDIDSAVLLRPFEYGVAIVKTKKGDGLLAKSGKWLLEPHYAKIERLEDTLFKVHAPYIKNDSTNIHTEGVISAAGKWIVPMNIYRYIQAFCGDYAHVEFLPKVNEKRATGLIDKHGKLAIVIQNTDSIHSINYHTCVYDSVFLVNLGKDEFPSDNDYSWYQGWRYNGLMNLKGALILNDTLNLSYLGDGYYEFQRHFEGNNWLFNSKGQRVTLPMDTLRYLENQRSNNTPDVKNQHRIASAKSEYKAAFDKMSFPTNQIEQLDTLDIDFMNTYNLIRASNFKNPNLNYNSIEDAEGNISDLDKNILLIEDSLCVVAQPTNNLYIKDNALGFKLFITNNTKNTYLFNTDANQLDILTQAMDKTGEWRNIEHFSYFSCGNGQHTSALDPQKYWLFAAPLYKGSFKTQMRIKVVAGVGELGKEYHTYASNFSHDNSVFYSNTFWGTINPAQLWREIRYSTDSIFDFEKD